MATIQLYTTALELQATHTITSRTSIHDPAQRRPGFVIRVGRPIGHVQPDDGTIARIIEGNGETSSYLVERSVKGWDTGILGRSSAWDRWSEYTLSPLSSDAERIVEAVLAKPVTSDGVRDTRIHINIAPSDLSSMLRRQQQLRTITCNSKSEARAAKASRIEALEHKVRVAQWRRAATYERLRGTKQTSWFDPRSTADENLVAAQEALLRERGND
ncbi:hypothetical protein [Rhodococcus sp. (in: high G+C Gram-positive bacteria)]|uniref:hypothetical protein n=1 Tax=Rhodococcus sp. TaxID=1831 RepID=UPI001A2A990E|nr:hypothetical protein [Rhodococcus sp. (in: high G+C Gram-positive bacteria)]MBJ7480900.1 hypothetical protein [Rhodococcus sp. (in: high G+C Gram-positive bacteria)]